MKLFLLCMLLALGTFAEENDVLVDPVEETSESLETPETPEALTSDLISLSALQDSLRERERQQEELHARLQAAGDDLQRASIRRELEETIKEVNDLRSQFRRIALSTDVGVFETQEEEEEFDWQQEAIKFVRPILAMLENLTAETRELAELQDRLEYQSRRRDAAKGAIENLDRLLEGDMEGDLRERLIREREVWRGRLRDAQNQITAVQNSLDQRMAEREDPVGRARGAATNFIRTTGRNLTFGVLAFLAAYLGMRGIYKAIRFLKPARNKGRSFSTRLFTLIWTLLGVFFGIGAMLTVFNITGDLFLLSLTVVFLVGTAWAAMKALPQFVELIRMMLNMGAVKEDQRLIFDGIPWKVESISFATQLVNPLLDGGEMLLPTRMLVGRHSRFPGEKEEWFPSRSGDWVVLSDGTHGRIAYQNPSAVQVISPGGDQKIYPVQQYIELSPAVLSSGFRRTIVFGIDYGHQAEVVSGIPKAMTERLRERLGKRLGDSLMEVTVLFSVAADSSLNFEVFVDCGGEAARHWLVIPAWTQSALVELCQERGWKIPFPQLQVHTKDRE